MFFRRSLIASILAFAFSISAISPAKAIIGGTDISNPNPYPWNTLIHITTDQSNFVCGASLIGARFVITAAHCVNGLGTANMYVTVGGDSLTAGQTGGQTIHVSSYIQHPNFNVATLTHDLALLILDEDAVNVKTPVYVTQTEIGEGRTATILGWGSITEGGPTVSELLEAQVETIDHATCLAALSGHGFDFDASTICAGVASGEKDTCQGDSGGPLFIVGPDGKPVQIGVTSWGVGCGRAGFPGAYADLSEMLGFLLNTLGGQAAVNLVDYALTGNQLKVAQIFDQIGAAAAADSSLRQDYGRLFMNGVAGTAKSLQSLLPTSAFEMMAMVQTFVSMESSNIMPRIRSLRDGTSGGMLDVSGMRLTNLGSAGAVDRATGFANVGGASSLNGTYDLTSAGTYSTDAYSPVNTSTALANANKMYDPNLYGGSQQPTQRTTDLYSGNVSSSIDEPIIIDGTQPQRLTETLYKAPDAPISAYNAAPSDSPYYAKNVMGYDSYGNPVTAQQQIQTQQIYQPDQMATQQAQGYVSSVSANSYRHSQQQYYAAQNNAAWRQQPAPQKSGGVLGWVSDLFGGNEPTNEARPNLPRTAMYTSRDLAYEQASRYPGQPLSMYARNMANYNAGYQTATYVPVQQQYGQPNSVKVDLPNQYAMVGNTPSPIVVTDANLDSGTYTVASAPAYSADRIGNVAVPISRPATVDADRRWGVFMSGDVRFGDEILIKEAGDTEVDNTAFTIGMDYRVFDKSFIGLALSYAHGSFTTGDFSDVQGNGYAVSLYGTTTFLKSAYLDGYISMGYHDFDSERTLFIGNGQFRTATAAPDAYHMSGKAELGYDIMRNAWKVTPFAGIRLSYADYSGYTETGGGNFDLNVYDRNDFSAIGSLGLGVSRKFMMSNGGIVAPALRVAYNHEFGDERADIEAAFVSAPTMPFTTEGAQRALDWVSFNPSVSAALINNWVFQADYEHDFLRYNVDTHIFNLAARYKW